MARAMELDPKSPPVAFFKAFFTSMNPAGAAPPEGVQQFEQLAARLDAERAATGRRFGLRDAEAHLWNILVRIASDAPRGEALRTMAARLLEQRSDFELGRQIADRVAERRSVAPPAVTREPC